MNTSAHFRHKVRQIGFSALHLLRMLLKMISGCHMMDQLLKIDHTLPLWHSIYLWSPSELTFQIDLVFIWEQGLFDFPSGLFTFHSKAKPIQFSFAHAFIFGCWISFHGLQIEKGPNSIKMSLFSENGEWCAFVLEQGAWPYFHFLNS